MTLMGNSQHCVCIHGEIVNHKEVIGQFVAAVLLAC